MDGVTLKRVTKIKYLGATLDSALQWNIHIKNIISKANRVSGLINSTLEWHAPQHTAFILYSSLVRRILEYCAENNDALYMVIQKLNITKGYSTYT